MLFQHGPFEYDDGQFQSKLEIPDGNDPNQNAWLTITVRYSLNFLDGDWNDKAGVTVEKDGKYFALDSDKNILPIRRWDALSTSRFKSDFQRGEKIWNYRFVLITPRDYSGLDYESMDGTGWVVRPNVLCLFRLVQDYVKPHRRIDVVRLDPSIDSKAFRSNRDLYDDGDPYRPTLGHELWHALDPRHIKELEGDPSCIADAQRGIYPNRCYGETEWEKASIPGGGSNIILLCAEPWLKRIAYHTQLDKSKWTATLDTNTPPRKIPLGVALVGMPAQF